MSGDFVQAKIAELRTSQDGLDQAWEQQSTDFGAKQKQLVESCPEILQAPSGAKLAEWALDIAERKHLTAEELQLRALASKEGQSKRYNRGLKNSMIAVGATVAAGVAALPVGGVAALVGATWAGAAMVVGGIFAVPIVMVAGQFLAAHYKLPIQPAAPLLACAVGGEKLLRRWVEKPLKQYQKIREGKEAVIADSKNHVISAVSEYHELQQQIKLETQRYQQQRGHIDDAISQLEKILADKITPPSIALPTIPKPTIRAPKMPRWPFGKKEVPSEELKP